MLNTLIRKTLVHYQKIKSWQKNTIITLIKKKTKVLLTKQETLFMQSILTIIFQQNQGLLVVAKRNVISARNTIKEQIAYLISLII